MAEQLECYIGRTACCQNAVACLVDSPDLAMNMRTIADWVREGLHVERVPLSQIQSGEIPLRRCQCWGG